MTARAVGAERRVVPAFAFLAVSAFSLFASSIARAQINPVLASECRGAKAGDTPGREVDVLYRQFECHFSRGQYAAGLPLLERACSLTDSPRCLLNLGAVHHALMHCELARVYYERYLDRVPYESASDDARNALAELETACRLPHSENTRATTAARLGPKGQTVPARTVPKTVPVQTGSDPADPIRPVPLHGAPSANLLPLGAGPGETSADGVAPVRRDTRPLPPVSRVEAAEESGLSQSKLVAWSLLGAGAASALSSIVAASYGYRAGQDADARYRQNGGIGIGYDPELRAIDRRGHRYDDLAIVFGIASGCLFGTGAAIWALDVSPQITPTDSGAAAATLEFSGSF